MKNGKKVKFPSDNRAKWRKIKNCKTPIEYHGKLPLRPQICPLRTHGNSPLCPTGHWPFGAAALLSLLFFSLPLQAGHRVPLTMCDPWMNCYPHMIIIQTSSVTFSSPFNLPFKTNLMTSVVSAKASIFQKKGNDEWVWYLKSHSCK